MTSTAPPSDLARRRTDESDRRWAAVRAVHWHDCEPTAETRARMVRERLA